MTTERINQILKAKLVVLNVLVVTLAVVAWGNFFRWKIQITIYELFPLFGLLAYSLMWVHYVAAATRRMYPQIFDLKTYFRWTSYVVLTLILLHPALIIYKQWQLGFGLPPGSLSFYVGKSAEVFVLLGLIAWGTFMLYELKPWLKQTMFWPYIVWLNDLAMILIWLHAFKLGSALRHGWYRSVWVAYIVVFLGCIAIKLLKPTPASQT